MVGPIAPVTFSLAVEASGSTHQTYRRKASPTSWLLTRQAR